MKLYWAFRIPRMCLLRSLRDATHLIMNGLRIIIKTISVLHKRQQQQQNKKFCCRSASCELVLAEHKHGWCYFYFTLHEIAENMFGSSLSMLSISRKTQWQTFRRQRWCCCFFSLALARNANGCDKAEYSLNSTSNDLDKTSSWK